MFKPIKQPLSYDEKLKGRIINSIIVLTFLLIGGFFLPSKITKVVKVYSGNCVLEDISVGDIISIKGTEMIATDSTYHDYDYTTDSAYLRFEEVAK